MGSLTCAATAYNDRSAVGRSVVPETTKVVTDNKGMNIGST